MDPTNTRYFNLAIFVLISLLFCGCNGSAMKELSTQLEQSLSEQERVKAELNKTTSRLVTNTASNKIEKVSLQSKIDALTISNEYLLSKHETDSQEISALRYKVDAFSQMVIRAKAIIDRLRGTNTRYISNHRSDINDGAASDFIDRPVGNTADLFPVHVFNVIAKNKVIGTVTDVIEKKDGTTRGNEWRSKRIESAQREKTTYIYEYLLSFSIRNLTKSYKTVRVEAGKGARDIALGPGDVLENQTIQAISGVSLNVTAGGQSRSFNLSP